MLDLIASESGTVTYPALAAAMTGLFTVMSGAIAVLFKMIAVNAQKCQDERARDQAERVVENKAWADRVETLQREHSAKSDKLFDQFVQTVKDGEQTKYNMMNTVSEASKASLRVEQSIKDLTDRILEVNQDILKAINDRKI